jgi:AcrR family transcriptional regulator
VDGKRRYLSRRRAEQARETRRRVMEAAAEQFARHGYLATTMAGVAAAAGVSTGTVELLFGRKVTLLKAAIDVAIAGDDEPVAILERPWVREAHNASDAASLLAVFAAQLRLSLQRSARLVHAAFEAAPAEAELSSLVDQLARNRRVVAAWLVDAIGQYVPLRDGLTRAEAVDTVWLLMEPAAYLRLATYRGWSDARYARWFAETTRHALVSY